MSLILGIDPGLNHTGWGIVQHLDNKLKYIACGRITTNPQAKISQRLLQISQNLSKIISLNNHIYIY